MKNDALKIIDAAIKAADPYENTKRLLEEILPDGKINVLAVGKAAVPMAEASRDVLGDRIEEALLVTKYFHSEGFSRSPFEIIEAGHPVSDDNSIKAAERGLAMAQSLGEGDVLLVLLSGGGSALLEKSRVAPDVQRDITRRLLERGAPIREINAVRKRLSLVKGGALAAAAYPARVITVALSDVLSNDKSVIASGITVRDEETDDFVSEVLEKYLYDIPDRVKETVFTKNDILINDGGYYFAGDINILCDAAGKKAEKLGYSVHYGPRDVSGEASEEAVRLIESVESLPGKHCYVFGGEAVVRVKGTGKGGRNQEAALSAAIRLRDKRGIVFACAGSDGTDGPTNAAGGIADGKTCSLMEKAGTDPERELADNNSYYALRASGSLIITGPTGTNVNDLIIILTEDYEK